jgi:MFS family permease
VLLVGAVYWLASLLSEHPAFALVAAALCACSPFVLEYAQRAQGYAFVALAVTAAVAAAIQHDRADRRRALWLGASLAASVLSLCLNYTAALVAAPLGAWVATRAAVSGRWRWGFAGACATVEVALVPLLLTQHDAFPNRSGVASIAGLTPTTLANMLEVPFGGRVNALRPLGIAVTVGALLALLGSRRFREHRFGAGRLLVLIAVGEPLSLVVLSAFGGHAFFGHLMLTRYAAVAAPFIIVAIALALEAIPWPLAGLLAAGAAVVTIARGIDNHRPQAFYLDARDVVAYVQAHVRPGDAVLAPPYPWDALPLSYYGLAPCDRGGPETRRRRRLCVLAPIDSG